MNFYSSESESEYQNQAYITNGYLEKIVELLGKQSGRVDELERITSHGPVTLTQQEYAGLKIDADLGRMVRNMPCDMKLVPRERCKSRYWATFMRFDGSDESDAAYETPEDALRNGGVTP